MNETIKKIPLALIDDPIDPMRSGIDMVAVGELAESIKENGLINPPTVRPVGDRYEVVAGHRRTLACRIANLGEINCVVRELDDVGVRAVMAVENLERQDVDPVDEAIFIGKYVGEDESKIPELQKKIGRSRVWIEERLDILTYPEYFLPLLKTGKLKLGVAKYLSKILDETYRTMYVKDAAVNGMSVAQAEYLFNLYEQGALKPLSELAPAPTSENPKPAPSARALCARCERMAIAPNLQNVFIHVECPAEVVVSAS